MLITNIINNNYENLTPTQKKICDYLLNNKERICYITLARLSKEIGCSEITILNLCKKLGYKNFIELKQSFRDYIEYTHPNNSTYSIKKPIFTNKSLESDILIKKIIEDDIIHIKDFYNNLDIELLKKLSKNVLNSRCVYIIGHDFSLKAGEFLQKRLDILNIPSVTIDLSDMYKTEFTISQMDKEDIAIELSFPNYYYATKTISRTISKKVSKLILITDKDDSPAVKYASDVIYCHNRTPIFINSWLVTLTFINIFTNIIATEME